MGRSGTWVYFDGNALTRLWDWYTEFKTDGKTGDPRAASPFAQAVLSDFVLDEIITNPVTDAYKKHLLLLLIFPDLPVLTALEQADLTQAQTTREILLRPPEFLTNAVGSRSLAMAGHIASMEALKTDIANKQVRIEQDAARSPTYVPKEHRVSFETAVTTALQIRGLDPSRSPRDFFDLCMTLYGFEASRYIDRPANERKGARRLLNQQIDYYHMTYLPFVDGFVTDDQVLARIANDLVRMFGLAVEVDTTDGYLSKWLRAQLLSGKLDVR